MKIFIIFITCILFSQNSFGSCFNPFGCKPKTYEECLIDAAKMPTPQGVNLYKEQCQNEFIDKPRLAIKQKQFDLDKKNRDEIFSRFKDGTLTLSVLTEKLGPPVFVKQNAPCHAFPNNKSPASCNIYSWEAIAIKNSTPPPIENKEQKTIEKIHGNKAKSSDKTMARLAEMLKNQPPPSNYSAFDELMKNAPLTPGQIFKFAEVEFDSHTLKPWAFTSTPKQDAQNQE